jgi:ABC-type sugar transport system substrate-binding protein
VWVALAVTMAAGASSGCGSGDFLPPPPAELQGALEGAPGSAPGSVAATPGQSSGTKTIDLILSGKADAEETEVQKAAARTQAGFDKVRLHIIDPRESPDSPGKMAATPQDQAQLVRAAVARHLHALVLEPADPADQALAQAVQEAGNAHVPVVLVGRSLTGLPQPTAAPPLAAPTSSVILVAPPPFAESAKQLVASAIRNAKNAKLNPQNGAFLLINTSGDSLIPDRVASIRDALKAAGITTVEEIPFVRDAQVAGKLLTDRLQANKKLALVFSFDSTSSSASNHVATELAQDRPFVQAAYTSDDNLIRMTGMGEFAAVVEFFPTRMLRKAISTAVSLAQGRNVAGRVEFPVVFHDSPRGAGLPTAQGRSQPKAQQSTE